jgi:ATP-binding cassette subfamily C protein CydCD
VAGPLDRRLLRESRAARSQLVTVAVLGALSAVAIVAQAALLACIVARAALEHAGLDALRGRLIALAAVTLLRAALSGAIELSSRLGAGAAMSELRDRLAETLLADRRAPADPSQQRTGELAAAAVQGVDSLASWFSGYLPQMMLAFFVPVAILAWSTVVDPIAAGVLLFTLPILILFMVLIGKSAKAQTDRRWRALSLLSAHFLDVVRGLPTLRAHRREQAQAATLAGVGERYRAETMATLRIAFMSALVLELCAMIGTALAAATIGIQLDAGALSLTAGLTVLLLAPELYAPLRSVGQQFHTAAEGTSAAQTIFAALDSAGPQAGVGVEAARRSGAQSDRPAGPVAPVPDPAHSPIGFQDVSYEYPQRPGAALQGVNLTIAPGEITALVGPSGAGKSTIARLVMRLAEPTGGRLLCGEVPLRDVELAAWREQIAWVPQRPRLFAGTLHENVLLGRPGASEADVLRSLRLAGALEILERLPQGLDTRLGEDAQRLSAGQRQRIALARAILRDAPLMILDEPTAHLDEDNAARIAELLPLLALGRTVLLIVHHPDLAERADRVLHIQAGTVREVSKMEEIERIAA